MQGTLKNPFSVEVSRSRVVVEHKEHGRNFGDVVKFSGAEEVPGTSMTIDGEYSVIMIPDEDRFWIEHSRAAGAAGVGGGTVAYEYPDSLPAEDALSDEGGFGEGAFGVG